MCEGGTGEVGGCTRRVQAPWPCLGSAVGMPLLAGLPYLEKDFTFVGFQRALIESLLIGKCGLSRLWEQSNS